MSTRMAMALLIASVAMCGTLVSAQYSSGLGKAIIIFGDSLSDNGNFFNLVTNQTKPVETAVINGTTYKAYYKGRFTNHPGVWSDHLKYKMKRTYITNYAFAGAAMCNDFPGAPFPHVPDQVETYLTRMKNDIKYRRRMDKYVHIPTIWAGGNDIQVTLKANPTKLGTLPGRIVECMVNATKRLLDSGEKVVVLGTMAPLEYSPFTIGVRVNGIIAPLIASINANIKKAVAQLSAAYKPHNQTVVLWDLHTDVVAAFTDYQKHGFKYNASMDCLNVPGTFSALRGSIPTYVCPKPDDYLFFDDLHPTSRAHKYIAQSLVDQMYGLNVFNNDDLKKPRAML